MNLEPIPNIAQGFFTDTTTYLLKVGPSLAGPFFGAFFGALAAILIETLRRRTEDKRKHYEAVLATQAVLISHGNSMLSIRNQINSSSESNPFANLKLMVLRFSQQAIDFGKLTFIGESSDPQLLLEIDVAQEGFTFVVDLLEFRNGLVDSFFKDPRTQIKDYDPATTKMSATGDLRLINDIKQSNEAVFTALLKAQKQNKKAFEQLFVFAKKSFPKKRLLYISAEHPPE